MHKQTAQKYFGKEGFKINIPFIQSFWDNFADFEDEFVHVFLYETCHVTK